MINRRVDVSQSGKLWVVLTGFAIIVYGLWQLSNSIAGGSPRMALLLGVGFLAFFVAGRIAGDWRSGVSLFIVWLLFEDLVRKYSGNSMYIYFVKDVLVGVTYLSLIAASSRRDAARFRPPFRYALGLFFVLGLVQVFNPLSPSPYYGVLGLKLYFYYVPLMFAGYAMLRKEDDLRRFLVLNMALATIISLVGILQTILGLDFLNPRGAGGIDELSHLTRYTPSGLAVARPPSVFVSDGRFGSYLLVALILGLGAVGLLLLRPHRTRVYVFPALGLVVLAAVLTGSRGSFVYTVATCLVLSVGMLWGAPPGTGDAYRLVKAIRRSFVYVVLAVGLGVIIFPNVVSSHWAFYRETLMPDSESFEAGHRVWDYPVRQLQNALSDPDWLTGHGIGTASLGVQYVSALLGVPPTGLGGENGFGTLVTEFGILGLILWTVWGGSLVLACCRVVLKLKGTWAFPMALSITWYAFLLLFPITWGGMTVYQNFTNNAFLWLLVGAFFRLPDLVKLEAERAQVTCAQSR